MAEETTTTEEKEEQKQAEEPDDQQEKTPVSSMNDLFTKAADRLKLLQEGDMIEGKILSVGKNEVYVDIDGIGLGVVRGRELYDDEQVLSQLAPGDKVYASVVDLENKEGNVELSFRKAGQERVWQRLKEMKEGKEIVRTKILEANKGGLMVNINNVPGFLPVSQLAPSHYPRVEDGDKQKILAALKNYVGEEFDVVVITAEQEGEKLIVSERAAIEGELMERLEEYNVGDVVEGVVTGVVDFGVFIKFGRELEGLVHISELAWQRIEDPNDLVKVGDKIKAQIISVDRDRVSLSVKRLQKDPWEDAVKKYRVGQVVKGRVSKIAPYGAFVELDADIHGLAHINELTQEDIDDPSAVVQEDEEYEFQIISIEPQEHRLGLKLASKAETDRSAQTVAADGPSPTDQVSDTDEKEGEGQTETESV